VSRKPPNAYDWANERLDGGLPEFLAEQLAAGASHEDIAFALRDHDITVSRETVRRWCNTLGLVKAAAS
jgi:hypothetical protein